MVKRYELNDAQWRRVEAMLPGKAGDPGRTANNRLFVDGVLWVLRSVAHLHDLPERYGKGKAFTPAFRAGPRPACGSAFSRLSPKTAATNISCSTQPGSRSPTGRDRKRGAQNQALGRSRGGLTTKIHMLADALGRPLRFILTSGQTHDVVTAPALLDGVDGGAIIADKAQNSNELRQLIADAGIGHSFDPIAQSPDPTRRDDLQGAQPHRALLQQAQAFPALRNALRSQGQPSLRSILSIP